MLALMAIGGAATVASAQQYEQAPPLPVPYAAAGGQYVPPQAQPFTPNMVPSANAGPQTNDDIRARLEQQDMQIRAMQAQLSGMQQGTAATPTAYAPSGGPAAAPAAAAPAGGTAAGLPPGATVVGNGPVPLSTQWNDGLQFSSANKEFTLHLGGRLQFDTGAFSLSQREQASLTAANNSNGCPPLGDVADFRRARIRADGTIYDNIDFVFEYDFATYLKLPNGSATAAGGGIGSPKVPYTVVDTYATPGPTDVYTTLKETPLVGNVRVGSMLYPFSFELSTSDRWIDFIERSSAFDALVPGASNANYLLGAMIFDWNADKTMTWWNSVSFNNQDPGQDTADGIARTDAFAWTGRFTRLLYYDEASNGRYLIHVGLDGQVMSLENDMMTFRTRGATRDGPAGLGPSYANTGEVYGRDEDEIGAEIVSVWGPLTVEAEWYGVQVTDDNGSGTALGDKNVYFNGGYVQALWFLTGENRVYNRTRGCFDRVVPYENYFNMPGQHLPCGYGAWQVGARYSYTDLNNQGIQGGYINELTLGLNWFLNPNLKYQFNYDLTERDYRGNDGAINGFGCRMVADF